MNPLGRAPDSQSGNPGSIPGAATNPATPTRPARGPRQPGRSGCLTRVQHAHKRATKKARLAGDRKLEPFEFYCWRHTFGTRAAESGMDKFSLARLMGQSSLRVAERYYIHVTEPHVTAGFGKFAEYLRKRQVHASPTLTDRPQ